MPKSRVRLLVASLLLLILIILAYIYFTKYHFSLSSRNAEKPLLLQDVSWKKNTMGNYNDLIIELSIEANSQLCENRNWCGFEEHGGSFEDVANTVAYALSLLKDNEIKSNLYFQDDGNHVPVSPPGYIKEKFDPNVPVRFIFVDGDNHTLPAQARGFSRGWGVDPKTKGLTILYASDSIQHHNFLHSGILGVMLTITNIMPGNQPLNENQYDEIINVWTNDNPSKYHNYTDDSILLKPLNKNE